MGSSTTDAENMGVEGGIDQTRVTFVNGPGVGSVDCVTAWEKVGVVSAVAFVVAVNVDVLVSAKVVCFHLGLELGLELDLDLDCPCWLFSFPWPRNKGSSFATALRTDLIAIEDGAFDDMVMVNKELVRSFVIAVRVWGPCVARSVEKTATKLSMMHLTATKIKRCSVFRSIALF